MSYTLAEIAKISGAVLDGDPGKVIKGVSTLAMAKPGDVSFLSNRRYVRFLKTTQASAIILSADYRDDCETDALVCDDPYLAFARVLRHMHPQKTYPGSVHASAIIAEKCDIASSAHVAANVVIEKACVVEDDVYLGPGCVLGENVRIGQGTRLAANVTINEGVIIGKNCILHSGVVIGADGFGIAREDDKWVKIPQVGGVQIGDEVEIGANTTIDRGAIADTVIEDGVKLDNQIQVGHGARIGAHTAIAGCVGIAGSAIIGKRCMIGGLSAISGHIEIADDVTITGMSGVSNSIKSAGVYSAGIPVSDNRVWRRNIARFRNLDDIARRLIKLEKDSDS